MDQYLLIPFLVGWTSINPSYFDVNYRGFHGFWHTAISCPPLKHHGSPGDPMGIPRLGRAAAAWPAAPRGAAVLLGAAPRRGQRGGPAGAAGDAAEHRPGDEPTSNDPQRLKKPSSILGITGNGSKTAMGGCWFMLILYVFQWFDNV